MAAQPNPFGLVGERSTTRTARQPKTKFGNWEYLQPSSLPKRQVGQAGLGIISLQLEPSSPNVLEQHQLNWEPEMMDVISAVGGNDPLPIILASLNSLMRANDDNEIVATPSAYSAARSVVESVYGRLFNKKSLFAIPLPILMTDDRGGIRVAWRVGNKHVRVTFGFSSQARSYLYFESPAAHDVDRIQPDKLLDKLEWLLVP